MNIEEDGKTYIKIKDRQEKSIIEKNKVLENLSKLEPLENEEYSIEEELEEVMKENKQLKERFERLVQEHIDTINRNEEKQQRIDKAIEYIKTHSEMTDLQICGIENVLAFRGSATKLLEILGDKE